MAPCPRWRWRTFLSTFCPLDIKPPPPSHVSHDCCFTPFKPQPWERKSNPTPPNGAQLLSFFMIAGVLAQRLEGWSLDLAGLENQSEEAPSQGWQLGFGSSPAGHWSRRWLCRRERSGEARTEQHVLGASHPLWVTHIICTPSHSAEAHSGSRVHGRACGGCGLQLML